jgi:hypothetical protein
MLATAAGEITWATIAGILAMACLAISPLFKHRTAVLLAQLGTSAGFGAHYALSGIATAAVSCGLSGIQVLLAIPLATRPSFKPVFYLFAPVLVVAAILTWQGPVSAMAAAALAFATMARMQERTGPLRLYMMGAQLAWLAHDVAVLSLPAIAGDVASLLTGAIMVARQYPAREAGRGTGLWDRLGEFGNRLPVAKPRRDLDLAKQHRLEQSPLTPMRN